MCRKKDTCSQFINVSTDGAKNNETRNPEKAQVIFKWPLGGPGCHGNEGAEGDGIV